MRILGVDPGTATTGFAVLEVKDGKRVVLDYGVVSTPSTQAMPDRLKTIYDDLRTIIAVHQPDCIAIEQLFFTNNITTGISVGQARGVVMLVGAEHNLAFAEYTPLQVKQAVTGYGKATKQQIQQMVKTILGLSSIPKPDDAADALAIAICHAATLKPV